MPVPENSPLRTHRFALAICGGIALGAYEAGVVCQLYRDLHTLNRHPDIAGKAHITVDAISGASAGSITGLILAQGIGLGLSPDDLEKLMKICWIDLLDIHLLLASNDSGGAARSIFSDNVVSQIIERSLSIPPEKPVEAVEPVALWMTMTNLDGVPYMIDFNRDGHAQPGDTRLFALDYKDFVPFLITGDKIEMVSPRMIPDLPAAAQNRSEAVWNLAADAARASSAFPIAFPSSHQSRDLSQYPDYMEFRLAVESDRQDSGDSNPAMQAQGELPQSATFQFVDGGLFSNQPIGRCIDAVAYLNKNYPERDPTDPDNEGKVGRSFVIIEPVPQTAKDVEAAFSADSGNIDAALPSAILGKILAAYSSTAVYADFRTAEETNRIVRNMQAALSELDSLGLPADRVESLKQKILAAAGLDDKSEITLQRIPLKSGPNRKLAGAFAGHFGGFFRADYREADFITGQSESRAWLLEWLSIWLGNHAEDIGKTASDISSDYVESLLGQAPPDPQVVSVPPTELTPAQLGNSNWFPRTDEDGRISYADRLAALTIIQRREIVYLAESRLLNLLEHWFHVPPLLAKPESLVFNYFVSPRLIDEPGQE